MVSSILYKKVYCFMYKTATMKQAPVLLEPSERQARSREMRAPARLW